MDCKSEKWWMEIVTKNKKSNNPMDGDSHQKTNEPMDGNHTKKDKQPMDGTSHLEKQGGH